MKKILFICRNNCEYSNKAYLDLLNLGWSVKCIISKSTNEILSNELLKWKGDYIFSFRSYLIIPEILLKNSKIAAINFHPASPKYRRSGGANFALYNNDKEFGCTAHLMDKHIDNGKIILVKKFKINTKDNLSSLLKKTHRNLYFLFKEVINGIKKNNLNYLKKSIKASSGIKWVKKMYKLKDIDYIQQIALNSTKKEIGKIIRSTYHPNFPPYIYIHGYKFILEKKV